jgi:hypothetical protein
MRYYAFWRILRATSVVAQLSESSEIFLRVVIVTAADRRFSLPISFAGDFCKELTRKITKQESTRSKV